MCLVNIVLNTMENGHEKGISKLRKEKQKKMNIKYSHM